MFCVKWSFFSLYVVTLQKPQPTGHRLTTRLNQKLKKRNLSLLRQMEGVARSQVLNGDEQVSIQNCFFFFISLRPVSISRLKSQSALLFTHSWRENNWIHTFSNGISAMWSANRLALVKEISYDKQREGMSIPILKKYNIIFLKHVTFSIYSILSVRNMVFACLFIGSIAYQLSWVA